jgi:hypothetical protein
VYTPALRSISISPTGLVMSPALVFASCFARSLAAAASAVARSLQEGRSEQALDSKPDVSA